MSTKLRADLMILLFGFAIGCLAIGVSLEEFMRVVFNIENFSLPWWLNDGKGPGTAVLAFSAAYSERKHVFKLISMVVGLIGLFAVIAPAVHLGWI